MGKITVKHYLNTNLKPYIIRGENYYSIYALVIVNRKNTKVKSINFEEIYTEKDFEDIILEDDLQQEISVIEKICMLILDVLRDFDTTFFSLYYTHVKNIFVGDIEFEEGADDKYNIWDGLAKKNKLNLGLDDFTYGDFSLSINKTKGMDIYTWYSKKGQMELSQYLQEEKVIGDIVENIQMLNKLVFLGSLQTFSEKLHETKKGKELYDKYSDILENDYWRYCIELRGLYHID